MISANTLKVLDFDTKEEYFDYVIESYLNGQISQLKNLIKKMSRDDKRQMFDYLNNSGESHNTQDTIAKYLID